MGKLRGKSSWENQLKKAFLFKGYISIDTYEKLIKFISNLLTDRTRRLRKVVRREVFQHYTGLFDNNDKSK